MLTPPVSYRTVRGAGGRPATRIVDIAMGQFDLIVMGTRRRGRFRAALRIMSVPSGTCAHPCLSCPTVPAAAGVKASAEACASFRRPRPSPGSARPQLRPRRRDSAQCCSMRSCARAPELARRQDRPLPHARAPARTCAPEMAGHFCHRALFIGPNARPAINEGRAEYIPVFLSDAPALFRRGILPARRRADQRLAARRTRLLLAGHVGRSPCPRRSQTAKSSSPRSTRPMPRTLGDSFVHVDDIDLGVEVDMPPYEHALDPRRRGRAAHRRVHRRAGARRRDAPDGHRRHPLGRRAWRWATSATWASTPR